MNKVTIRGKKIDSGVLVICSSKYVDSAMNTAFNLRMSFQDDCFKTGEYIRGTNTVAFRVECKEDQVKEIIRSVKQH